MFKTIQAIAVIVAGTWALLAAMMTQAKDQAITNLRTWLPDAIVDLLAAMPEPLIAHRNGVYAGLAVLAFGLVLGPPAYRLAIDRDKRLSIFGWTQSVSSRLRNGGLNPFESALIAILISSMLYLAQSWALVSVIGGVLIFYAFSQRSASQPKLAASPEDARLAPASVATAPDPQTYRDLSRLLEFAVHQSTVLMLDDLLRSAPDIVDEPLQLGGDFSLKNTTSQEFLEIIRRKMDPGSQRRSDFERVMHEASAMAEHRLEQTPIDQRPNGIDPLLLRKWVITHSQCVRAIGFLQSHRAKAEENLLNQRFDLLKRYRELTS
jgi:hypothetical protein